MQRFLPRAAPKLSSHISRKFSSTLIKDLQDLSVDVKSLLEDKTFTESELEDLHKLLQSDVPTQTANRILKFGLPHDFSLYFTVGKLAKPHQWDELALLALVENNPGRVISLTDLAKKHSTGPVSRAIRQVLLKKLLYGENVEIRDGEFELTDSNVRKAIGILNELESVEGNERELKALVEFLETSESVVALSLLKLDGMAGWLCKDHLSLKTERIVFLQIARFVFETAPELLSKETLSKILAFSADYTEFEHSPKALKVLENLGMTKAEISESAKQIKALGENVLAFVEKGRLDLDKRDAEAHLLRMQLIQTYGIDRDDIDTALRKFHTYQTHEKFGIELVQSKLVQAFCYQAFKNADETSLKVAQALIIPEEIQVKTICHLILAQGKFDSEKSLDIYNAYISQVSNKLNANTGRSPAGLLTEAMMIASLYENDREFAQLLQEKGLEKLVVAQDESYALRKPLKVYGEAFADDSWDKAKPKLEKYVLATIRNL